MHYPLTRTLARLGLQERRREAEWQAANNARSEEAMQLQRAAREQDEAKAREEEEARRRVEEARKREAEERERLAQSHGYGANLAAQAEEDDDAGMLDAGMNDFVDFGNAFFGN